MSLAIILDAAPGGLGQYGNLIMLGAVFIVFYFFMIRPQQKKQKELKAFRESLSKGTEVVTNGGMFGKITEVATEHVMVEIDRGVKIKVLKSSVNLAGEINEK